jgi:hypothetical protein
MNRNELNRNELNRKRYVRILIAVAALMAGSVAAFAHNGVEHVMGTVSTVTSNSIMVETVTHTTVTVMVDPSTTFSHRDMKASLKDLKVGERVVINAREGADKKLQGISVKWGPTPAATTSHADHKM